MAEKLSEANWTAFTKKLEAKLDDAPLTKALAKVEKTPESKAEQRRDALDELVTAIQKQQGLLAKLKKELAGKIFSETSAKLEALLDSARREQGAAAQAARAAEEDEDQTPALLTSKMIPLLRELRKGEARMHAMVCTAGKATAVLIMRKAIAASRRKLLAEAVDAAGGAKYLAGECFYEDNALIFVMQGSASGLAKRLRAALFEQTALRLKVRVRGDDGAEDHDGEDEPATTADASAAAQAPAATAEKQTPAPSPELLAFRQRFEALDERLQAALKQRHPEATKLRAVAGFASQKAEEQGDVPAAMKALDMLDKLLSAGGAGGGSVGGNGRADALAAWQARRQAAITSLKGMANRIAAARHPSSAKALLEINAVLKNLTAAPSTRQQVDELLTYLNQDDVVQDVCELAEDIRAPLLGVLNALRPHVAG